MVKITEKGLGVRFHGSPIKPILLASFPHPLIPLLGRSLTTTPPPPPNFKFFTLPYSGDEPLLVQVILGDVIPSVSD